MLAPCTRVSAVYSLAAAIAPLASPADPRLIPPENENPRERSWTAPERPARPAPRTYADDMAHSPPLRRFLFAALATVLFVGVLVWSMAMLLLMVAETAGGRWTALALVLGVPPLCLAPFAASLRRQREPALAALGVVLAIGGLALGRALHLASDATDDPSAVLRSVYLGEAKHRRYGLANLVPELDQFTLGSYLMPAVDPYLDGEQTLRVRALFRDVYRDLAKDPAFEDMGSAMPWSYRELFGGRPDVGHLYVYTPPHEGDEALPVLVFLHGWGGPFLGYQWVFQRFAKANGYAIVAPSYGMGWWRQRGAMTAVERTLEWIDDQPSLDGSRLILAGLSNGGPGVSQAAITYPERWNAVVFLSAVMDTRRLASLGESLAQHDTPVLVITGDAERRIPLAYTETCVDSLRQAHQGVDLRIFPGEDHFLLFSQPDAVMELLAEWVGGLEV